MPEGGEHLHRTLVVDGSPEIQRWMDAVNASAVHWLEPHDVPYSAVTVAAIWNAVAINFKHDGAAWSVAELGLPPIDTPDGLRLGNQTVEPDDFPSPVTDPNPGGKYHTWMHSLLGDFHS